MHIFGKQPTQISFPKNRIRSKITLRFCDPAIEESYSNLFITTVKPIIITAGIWNFVVLLLILLIAIIVGEVLKSVNSLPYKLCDISVPIQIFITGVWMLLPLRIPKLRSYAGIVPIIEWLVFLTEYVCYGNKELILTSVSIVIYMAILMFGSLLCNMWMASATSFILGSIYFVTKDTHQNYIFCEYKQSGVNHYGFDFMCTHLICFPFHPIKISKRFS
jgi:hypothetical protein